MASPSCIVMAHCCLCRHGCHTAIKHAMRTGRLFKKVSAAAGCPACRAAQSCTLKGGHSPQCIIHCLATLPPVSSHGTAVLFLVTIHITALSLSLSIIALVTYKAIYKFIFVITPYITSHLISYLKS